MNNSMFRFYVGTSTQTMTLSGACLSVVRQPQRRERPGARRRAELESTPEGHAKLMAARKAIGDMLVADGIAPLAAIRMRAGMSQDDVFKKTGIQQPHLSRLENGKTPNPQLDTVRLLAALYGTSSDAIADALAQTIAQANS